jgi:hypothetical protein
MSDVWPAPLRDLRPNQHDRTVPSCNGVVTVPIQSTLPPRPLPLPEPQNLSKTATWGVVLEVIGLLLCWTVVGAIVGIPLFIVGRRMAKNVVKIS